MNRTDRSTSQLAEVTLRDLRETMDGMKGTKQFFGPDALTIQRIGRTSGWDINQSIPPYALRSFSCIFNNNSIDYPYVEFNPNINITSPTGFEVVTIWPDPTRYGRRANAWIVTLSNDANTVNFQIAAAFKCTDSGSVTVTAL